MVSDEAAGGMFKAGDRRQVAKDEGGRGGTRARTGRVDQVQNVTPGKTGCTNWPGTGAGRGAQEPLVCPAG